MRNQLEELWQQQKRYNLKIRQRDNPDNLEYWTKQYLLGVVSEIDEVLQEINWKIHRKGHSTDRVNLARELADVTKYVWCLWELHGFSSEEMLTYVKNKSDELEHMYQQDFVPSIPPGSDVIISDIDGTIGDWRAAFIAWYCDLKKIPLIEDRSTSLAIEVDLGIDYLEYRDLKEKFESEGGYSYLVPYMDTVEYLNKCAAAGSKIVYFTSRPAKRYGRIWMDTKEWLNKYNFPEGQLYIGSEERVGFARNLQTQGCSVLMLEDDPTLALRAAASNIMVFLRDQPYNQGISHQFINRVTITRGAR